MFLIYILLLDYFCANGMILDGSSGQITFNNENYLYIDEQKKQSEAKSDCETKGGQLLTYLDETNVDAVYDAAEDGNNQELWVGLKVDDDGKYQWEKSQIVLGTAKTENTNFKLKDIDIKLKKNPNGKCVTMRRKNPNLLEFFGRGCDTKRRVFCEKAEECSVNAPLDASCCNNKSEKCGENEGDCDDDSHCKPGLKCGKDNCPSGFPSIYDCCYIPEECSANAPIEFNCCKNKPEKCGENEGDCNSDSHCKPGLRCGKGNCPSGFPSYYDCCTSSATTASTTTTTTTTTTSADTSTTGSNPHVDFLKTHTLKKDVPGWQINVDHGIFDTFCFRRIEVYHRDGRKITTVSLSGEEATFAGYGFYSISYEHNGKYLYKSEAENGKYAIWWNKEHSRWIIGKTSEAESTFLTAYALAMSDDDKKCVDETEKTTWSYEKNGDSSKVTYENWFISLSGEGLTGGIRIKKKSDDIRDESVWEKCGKDQQGWYGYKEGKENGGSISTLLSGNGKAKLNFGNCGTEGQVEVYLNDDKIDTASKEQMKTVTFDFKDGDKLELRDIHANDKPEEAVIKFNSFEVIEIYTCGFLSSNKTCTEFSFFDGNDHVDYTAGKCRYDYLFKKSWCHSDKSWDWCNSYCSHDNECLSAKKNDMIHIQGKDGNAYYRPKDDVKMKATDAKAECERLETEIAKVGGLFNVLPSDEDTWVGVNLVTKDATRMYQLSSDQWFEANDEELNYHGIKVKFLSQGKHYDCVVARKKEQENRIEFRGMDCEIQKHFLCQKICSPPVQYHGRVTSWLEWDICKETAPGSPLVQVRKKYCVSRWSHDQDHDELKCNPDEPLNETRSCEDPEMKGLRCLGTDSHCCTEDNKCDEYEGNCEENSHCKEGLVCGTKNCKDNWRGKMDFDANDNCCKEEDKWSDWTDIDTECELNATLNEYHKEQTRDCLSDTCDGLPESSKQLVKCEPEDGIWSQWTNWDSECEKSDNVWRISRTRTCTDPEPKYNGLPCCFLRKNYQGNDIKAENNVENESKCQEKCSENTDCKFWTYVLSSKQCWLKTDKTDTEDISTNTISGPKSCDDLSQEFEICPPVDGIWSQWTAWDSECQKSDEDSNVWRKSRTRTCTDPEPEFNGLPCCFNRKNYGGNVIKTLQNIEDKTKCQEKCSEFKGYHIESTIKTLAEATTFCKNLGQKLFEPKSLEASNELYELAKPHVDTWGPWIGIHDQINEGIFVYDSSNARIVYENWDPRDVHNYMGKEEDCVIMGLGGGTWFDAPCNMKLPFVCESDCTGWTYMPSSKTCYLKNDITDTEDVSPNHISGPKSCDDLNLELETCPAVDGTWGDWDISTGDCKLDEDGKWTKEKSRNCASEPKFGGLECTELTNHLGEREPSVGKFECPPEHGSWSQWTDWDSECQKSDVDSNVWRKSRTRTCTDPEPKYGGDDCNGIATKSIECDPINGKWQKYGNWSTCSENCVQFAERECIVPQYGGNNCQGNAKKQQFCSDGECKGNGCYHVMNYPTEDIETYEWADWNFTLEDCQLKCQELDNCLGFSVQLFKKCSLKKSIDQNETKSYNNFISGPKFCPIDGDWSDFGLWLPCSSICGNGTMRRFRTCTDPEPKYGGTVL